jgi:UDP-MurNAc hydroxylase
MRFQILSHAGMLVEAEGVKLVSDPWILGSCYWRSWWNYPKPAEFSKENVNYIYLTHMHWDHFHGPSLRKFPASVTFLVPKAPTDCIVRDLADFPCKRIIEMPHGKTMELRPTLRVTSYHYGLNTDSALLIEDGKTVLLNMNDCKLAGGSLKQVMRRHPRIDFLFRSHSSAQPYPTCVEAEKESDLQLRNTEFYVSDFVESARLLKPKYAIPFASNNCFLHRETWQYNPAVVSPLEVKSFFDAHGPAETECRVMVAGDSWSDGTGFDIQEQDFFTEREKHLREYAEEVAPALEESYRKEDKVKLGFEPFAAYFREFMRSLPWLSTLAFKPVMAFEVEGRPETLWILDFGKKKVYEAKSGEAEYGIKYRVHPAVLRDCVQRKMFTLLFPSKRVRIELRKGHLRDYFAFEQLFDLYEYGLLPLRGSRSARAAVAWGRRWRGRVYMAVLGVRATVKLGREAGVDLLLPRNSL